MHVRACVRELASYALAKVYQNYFADSTACAWVRVCIGGTGSVVGWVCGRLSGTRKQEFGASEIGGIATARSGAQSLSLERTHAHALCFCSSLVTTHALVCARAHTHTHTHTHTHIHTHRHTKVQTYKHTHTNDCVGVRSFLALARCVVVKSSGAVHSLSLSLSRSLARSLAGTCRHSLTFTLGQCTASLAHFFVLAVPQKLATVSVN